MEHAVKAHQHLIALHCYIVYNLGHYETCVLAPFCAS